MSSPSATPSAAASPSASVNTEAAFPASFSPTSSKIRAFIIASRAPTWLCLLICFAIVTLVTMRLTPTCRPVNLADASINYPKAKHEAFPSNTLIAMILLPIPVVYAPFILWLPTIKPRFWIELNSWTLLQITSVLFTMMVTDIAKLYAGRLRPDFISRLRLAGALPPATRGTGGLADDGSIIFPDNSDLYGNTTIQNMLTPSMCTNPKYAAINAAVGDGRLSFPSGHSSESFSAIVPVTVFLISRLRPFHLQSLWRLLASLLPLVLPLCVAISRTVDNRHHFADIVAGSAIGTFGALVSSAMYLQWSSPGTGSGSGGDGGTDGSGANLTLRPYLHNNSLWSLRQMRSVVPLPLPFFKGSENSSANNGNSNSISNIIGGYFEYYRPARLPSSSSSTAVRTSATNEDNEATGTATELTTPNAVSTPVDATTPGDRSGADTSSVTMPLAARGTGYRSHNNSDSNSDSSSTDGSWIARVVTTQSSRPYF